MALVRQPLSLLFVDDALDSMPVILDDEGVEMWLDRSVTKTSDLLALLKSYRA